MGDRLFRATMPVLTVIACSMLLSACSSTGGNPPAVVTKTPEGLFEIRDIGRYPSLPRTAGRHRRQEVINYEWGSRDFSVSYAIEGTRYQLVSTVYFYDLENFPPGPMQSLRGHFASVAASITEFYPNALYLDRTHVTADVGGQSIEGMQAKYRFTVVLGTAWQEFYSELSLYLFDGHAVMFRHTGSLEQRTFHENQIAVLERAIDWSDPSTITSDLLRMFEEGVDQGTIGVNRPSG